MSENEKLLSNYRTTNIRQSMELDEVSCISILIISEFSIKMQIHGMLQHLNYYCDRNKQGLLP